jgi:ketol-acid reductoisomerase
MATRVSLGTEPSRFRPRPKVCVLPPASQYGRLLRRGRYDGLNFHPVMKNIVEDIVSGKFADKWDQEASGGYQALKALREVHAGDAVKSMEADLMAKLGSRMRENMK